ncbi:MAG: sigma-54 interaction domain-containing protein [Planctomycetota bacterium]
MSDEESVQGFADELNGLLLRAERSLPKASVVELRERLTERIASWDPSAVAEADAEEEPLPARFGIIGEGEAMQEVFDKLAKMIQSDYPVLVTGGSGTGKELVARALHFYGPRKKRKFLSENCAAIPVTLLESILFGHVKGSFTGAHRDNPGHFVAADKGTIFLDELGDMPLAMQGKLLRVLQDGEVRPVGGDRIRKVDVRLIAATNKDPRKLVAEKAFREDLYFRLNVLELHLPPLRERGEDILLIAEHFLREARAELRRKLELSDAAKEALQSFSWPGNVRQLENEIRRAVALRTGERLEAEDFSFASC